MPPVYTPLLPPPPPPKFDFSWDIFMSQEKLQTMVMQTFWGVIEVYYGIVQVVNYDHFKSAIFKEGFYLEHGVGVL